MEIIYGHIYSLKNRRGFASKKREEQVMSPLEYEVQHLKTLQNDSEDLKNLK